MSEMYDILDNLSARGNRLQGKLPADYKPVVADQPISDVLARVYSLILSWPALETEILREGEGR